MQTRHHVTLLIGLESDFPSENKAGFWHYGSLSYTNLQINRHQDSKMQILAIKVVLNSAVEKKSGSDSANDDCPKAETAGVGGLRALPLRKPYATMITAIGDLRTPPSPRLYKAQFQDVYRPYKHRAAVSPKLSKCPTPYLRLSSPSRGLPALTSTLAPSSPALM